MCVIRPFAALTFLVTIAGVASAQAASPGATTNPSLVPGLPPPPPPPPPPPQAPSNTVPYPTAPTAPLPSASPTYLGTPAPVYGGYYMGGPAPRPIAPPSDGSHLHDGFYLRMGLGVGYLGAKFSSDDSTTYGGKVDGTLGHGALAFELAIGSTPMPGLVVGGGVYFDGTGNTSSRSFNVNGNDAGKVSESQFSAGIVGPFVDYYFNPKAGWHIQGALGAAWMTVGPATQTGVAAEGKRSLDGFGFMIGGGYEWWIAKHWSLGILLRGTLVGASDTKEAGHEWSYGALGFPELLLGVTYQ